MNVLNCCIRHNDCRVRADLEEIKKMLQQSCVQDSLSSCTKVGPVSWCMQEMVTVRLAKPGFSACTACSNDEWQIVHKGRQTAACVATGHAARPLNQSIVMCS